MDFSKAVSLQPNFPVAHVQKLYTDYRAANSIGDHSTINSVLEKFKEATEKFPKCVETWALYAQVMNDQQVKLRLKRSEQSIMKLISVNRSSPGQMSSIRPA